MGGGIEQNGRRLWRKRWRPRQIQERGIGIETKRDTWREMESELEKWRNMEAEMERGSERGKEDPEAFVKEERAEKGRAREAKGAQRQ